MGLFDFFKKKSEVKYVLMDFLNGRAPIYNVRGEAIYRNEVVQDCIFRVVSELKKLKPMHIVESDNGDIIPQRKSVHSRTLRKPNPIMTTSEFIEKMAWNLLLNHNAFAYHYKKDGEYILYPIQPKHVEFVKNQVDDIYVKMDFANGESWTLPYANIIHLRFKYSVNEFLGGNENGQPDTESLGKVLALNDAMLDGLKKQLKINMNVVGAIKMKTMQNFDAQMQEVKNFEQKLENNESGLLPMDVSAEFIPINTKTDYLSSELLTFIDEKIYRPWGVSSAIMRADYTKEQKESFYETALEHIIISMNDAFTKGMFTSREIGFGNQIVFFPKALQFCSMSQRIEVVRMLGDSGTMFENEKRYAFGMMPSEELVGVRMMSKNYGLFESVSTMDMVAPTPQPTDKNIIDEGGNENE